MPSALASGSRRQTVEAEIQGTLTGTVSAG